MPRHTDSAPGNARTVRVSGNCVGPTGAAVVACTVAARARGGEAAAAEVAPVPTLAEARSGADGRFELRLPAGAHDVVLLLTADELVPMQCPIDDLGAADVDLGRIEMPAGTRVQVRATDPLGAPLEDARVCFELVVPAPEADRHARAAPRVWVGCDALGRGTTPALQPGPYRLHLVTLGVGGAAAADPSPWAFEVHPDAGVQTLTITSQR